LVGEKIKKNDGEPTRSIAPNLQKKIFNPQQSGEKK